MYRFELKSKRTNIAMLASRPFNMKNYGIEHDKFIDFIASKGQWYYGDSNRFDLYFVEVGSSRGIFNEVYSDIKL